MVQCVYSSQVLCQQSDHTSKCIWMGKHPVTRAHEHMDTWTHKHTQTNGQDKHIAIPAAFTPRQEVNVLKVLVSNNCWQLIMFCTSSLSGCGLMYFASWKLDYGCNQANLAVYTSHSVTASKLVLHRCEEYIAYQYSLLYSKWGNNSMIHQLKTSCQSVGYRYTVFYLEKYTNGSKMIFRENFEGQRDCMQQCTL